MDDVDFSLTFPSVTPGGLRWDFFASIMMKIEEAAQEMKNGICFDCVLPCFAVNELSERGFKVTLVPPSGSGPAFHSVQWYYE